MALTDQLVSYYKCDEASGDALDAHSTNDLSEIFTVGSATGIINNARDFPGSSAQFDLADNTDMSIGEGVSFEFSCWFQFDTTTGTKQVICKRTGGSGTGTNLEYILRVETATPVIYWTNSVDTNFDSLSWGTALSIDTWYFCTFGYDADNEEFFIQIDDGTPQTKADALGVRDLTNPFHIGGSGGEFFSGLIDEVGFWKGRVLTAQERTDLYNSGAGLSYDDFGAGGGLSIPIAAYVNTNKIIGGGIF